LSPNCLSHGETGFGFDTHHLCEEGCNSRYPNVSGWGLREFRG
jgi:hypothetical protein